MSRADWTTWLSGPRDALGQQGIDLGTPGSRLGLPADGVGSVAPMTLRVGALFIDWFACMFLVRAFMGAGSHPLVQLEVFYAEVAILTALTGASFGQRLVGIAVVGVRGQRLSVVKVAARTFLVCLVVPALIWDRDQRGAHDLAVGGVVVRSR